MYAPYAFKVKRLQSAKPTINPTFLQGSPGKSGIANFSRRALRERENIHLSISMFFCCQKDGLMT